MYDSDIPCIWAVLTFLQRHNHTYTDRQTYLYNVWYSDILIFCASQLYSLPLHTHRHTQTDLSSHCMIIIFLASQLYSHSPSKSHTHTLTDRLIFTMYDDHIPCISAVFLFIRTHTHTHSFTLTDRQTYLHNVWWSYSVHLSCIHSHSQRQKHP